MDKGSGSGIFPDPDQGDQKRPDPTGSGSGSATLPILHISVLKCTNTVKISVEDPVHFWNIIFFQFQLF